MQQRFHDKFNPKKLAVEIKKSKKKKKKKVKPESLQSAQKPTYIPKIQTLPTNYTGYFEIDKYSHHFVIRNISPIGQQLINKFANTQIQWKMDGFGMYARRVPHKVFGARCRPHNLYRFHRGQYKEFGRFLANNGVDIAEIVTQEYGFNKPDILDAEITQSKTPRDYQVPIIAYMISPEPSNIKLVEVQAGKGKTYMSMAAASVINTRIVMFLKFQYIEKWEKDLAELLHLEPDDICVINGSDKLIAAIHRISAGEYAPKAVLVSSRTFQNWVKEYEEKGDDIREIYGCSPHEFCEYIRAGLRVIDEVHQEFHLNFKIDLYTHVRHSISLSATLISDLPFVARMMEAAYPMDERYNGMEFDRYVDSIAVRYRTRQPELLTPNERNNPSYSHNAFEKGIMTNHDLFQGYLTMIEKMVIDYYYNRAKEGEKCLVYCSSIAMCTVVAEFLKRSFPDKNVQRYVEDDPYHFLLESDISVSTVGSAGTGHDIPDLITVILTAAINSTAANIQGFGRLRNLAGKQMIFVFLSCDDVAKHDQYRENKMKLLEEKSLTLKEIRYPGEIG